MRGRVRAGGGRGVMIRCGWLGGGRSKGRGEGWGGVVVRVERWGMVR